MRNAAGRCEWVANTGFTFDTMRLFIAQHVSFRRPMIPSEKFIVPALNFQAGEADPKLETER